MACARFPKVLENSHEVPGMVRQGGAAGFFWFWGFRVASDFLGNGFRTFSCESQTKGSRLLPSGPNVGVELFGGGGGKVGKALPERGPPPTAPIFSLGEYFFYLSCLTCTVRTGP